MTDEEKALRFFEDCWDNLRSDNTVRNLSALLAEVRAEERDAAQAEVAELKARIERGRAALADEWVARDWLSREAASLRKRISDIVAHMRRRAEVMRARGDTWKAPSTDEACAATVELLASEIERREWDAVARAEIATLREAATLRERISDACDVLAAAGCSCECGHDSEGHTDECKRCLGCRIEAVLT